MDKGYGMDDLVKRLCWNAENSATASRLNMAMDANEAADEIERLCACLEGRDKFIVDHDLWGEFVDSLHHAARAGDGT